MSRTASGPLWLTCIAHHLQVGSLQKELSSTRSELHRTSQAGRQAQGHAVIMQRELEALRSRAAGSRDAPVYEDISPSRKIGCVQIPPTGMVANEDVVRLRHRSKAQEGARPGIGW